MSNSGCATTTAGRGCTRGSTRTDCDADAITFHEPTGTSLIAMDRKKKSEDIGKLYATMGDITKTHASVFSKMKMPDLKVCMAITTLFLG